MAQPFDTGRLELAGEPVALGASVSTGYSVSSTGTLVYTGLTASGRQLTWFDRQGKALGTIGPEGAYNGVTLSPDGRSVAFSQGLTGTQGRSDIWIWDIARSAGTRLTSAGNNSHAIWTPDGSKVTYWSIRDRSGQILQRQANGAGTEESLYEWTNGQSAYPQDWTPDGRTLLFEAGALSRDLFVLPSDGVRRAAPFVNSEFIEAGAQISPDGRYAVYHSNDTGKAELYVTSFPSPSGGKWTISNGGGQMARWRRDGKELLYFTPDGKLMSVDVSLSPSFKAGIPKVLFAPPVYQVSGSSILWDISPDGQRFLINTAQGDSSAPVTAVLNWQGLLKK
jgi:Tol biopolymer transport system component